MIEHIIFAKSLSFIYCKPKVDKNIIHKNVLICTKDGLYYFFLEHQYGEIPDQR